MAQAQISRRWCFTLNNPSAEEYNTMVDSVYTYMIIGRETAPETGTKHLQGYMLFVGNKRLSAMKKLNGRAHWESAKGTTEQNVVYCSKGQDFTEYGDRPKTKKEVGQDEKQRWIDIIAHAKNGTLEEHDPKVYYNTFTTAERIYAKYNQPVGIEKEVMVYWGSTGTGKSHTAWENAGPGSYGKDPRTKFWQHYIGQENVVIDEFRGGIDIAHMLRWLDKYPITVEVKGSSTALMAQKVWITSNLHPKDWYPDIDAATLDALLRRLKVTHFVNKHLK
jgi:hypothetical protein